MVRAIGERSESEDTSATRKSPRLSASPPPFDLDGLEQAQKVDVMFRLQQGEIGSEVGRVLLTGWLLLTAVVGCSGGWQLDWREVEAHRNGERHGAGQHGERPTNDQLPACTRTSQRAFWRQNRKIALRSARRPHSFPPHPHSVRCKRQRQ